MSTEQKIARLELQVQALRKLIDLVLCDLAPLETITNVDPAVVTPLCPRIAQLVNALEQESVN